METLLGWTGLFIHRAAALSSVLVDVARKGPQTALGGCYSVSAGLEAGGTKGRAELCCVRLWAADRLIGASGARLRLVTLPASLGFA